ncbi:MAG: DUF86 domain-containing protein [Candidatus Omnitrophica bacterium]|nr:DUF86 domain-containing protein [Candidatus Omnitrophota bacterium]
MSKRNHELYLDEIKEAIASIFEYTRGISFNAFISDKKTRDAVIRNFEIL